jgi:hypothetical protein
VDAARAMLDAPRRCEFQKRVILQKNRAVFEIPDILQQIAETI